RAADARARLDHRLDDGCRQAQARRVRHRSAHRARRSRSRQARARRQVPTLRVAADARGHAVRVDLVQGAVRVRRVPGALRPLQGALMSLDGRGSRGGDAQTEQLAEALLAGAVGGAPGSRRRGRFHTLRVAEIRPLTDDAIEVTFAVPAELAGDYDYLAGQHVALRAQIDGHELRRSYSLCRPSTSSGSGDR